jgi:hypothetical protein
MTDLGNSSTGDGIQTRALTARCCRSDAGRRADENEQEFVGHLTRKRQRDLVRLLKDVVYRRGWKNGPVS